MIKKDVPVKLSNPNSNMFKVYQAVLHGINSRQSIVVHTRLNHGKVKSALWNLAFTGMVRCIQSNGRTRYVINDGKVQTKINSSMWANVSSPFLIGGIHAGQDVQ